MDEILFKIRKTRLLKELKGDLPDEIIVQECKLVLEAYYGSLLKCWLKRVWDKIDTLYRVYIKKPESE